MSYQVMLCFWLIPIILIIVGSKIAFAEGYMNEEIDYKGEFFLATFCPAINIIFLIGITIETIMDYKQSKKVIVNYELKYKTLTKGLVKQGIVTEEQIKDIEDATTLIEKIF